ncbi:hypothetical protein E2P81_ATG10570 [Venturia nashicola]|nr:hypothetical protein E2P81_ATG10570 [Venturia nashicola]
MRSCSESNCKRGDFATAERRRQTVTRHLLDNLLVRICPPFSSIAVSIEIAVGSITPYAAKIESRWEGPGTVGARIETSVLHVTWHSNSSANPEAAQAQIGSKK